MSRSEDSYRKLFGEGFERDSYREETHNFSGMLFGKPVCSKCGLIRLRNNFTEWAVNKGCLHRLHPDYARMKRSTRPEGL